LSKAVYVGDCLNSVGPSTKKIKNLVIDSVLVPWGKVEKVFLFYRIFEKFLKFKVYKLLDNNLFILFTMYLLYNGVMS